MDSFNDVLTTFLGLERGSYVTVYGRVRNKKYLNLCYEDKRRSLVLE